MNTSTPDCSVLIANYNGENLLPDCIDSVLAQRCEAGVEIIVHDDASTDDSLALLHERYPQVSVIASGTNVGFCIANNRMATLARGKYLLLLNNDAALYPDAIPNLLASATESGRREILTLPQFAWSDGKLINRGCRLDPFYNVVPIQVAAHGDPAMVEGSCLFIPASLWNEIGGFPDWFGSIAEDAVLCCAARLADARIRCLADSGYRHRQGASFGGNRILGAQLHSRYRRRYLSERNRISLLVSCTPTWVAWPWLALHLVLLSLEIAALCALQRNLDPWRKILLPAMVDAYRMRNSILTLRENIQAQRAIGFRDYTKAFVFIPQRLRLLFRHGLPTLGE